MGFHDSYYTVFIFNMSIMSLIVFHFLIIFYRKKIFYYYVKFNGDGHWKDEIETRFGKTLLTVK